MPKVLDVLINPHPLLRKKSAPLDLASIKDRKFKEFLADLKETMLKRDGAGLAAPQVGRNIRVIVVRDEDKSFVLINPRLTKKSWAKEIEDEGCLSVLNVKGDIIYAPVARYRKVNCLYLDEEGRTKKISAEKILARILQHEIDHLDGILFIDKIEKTPKRIRIKDEIASASQA